jgi:hypothetical protein
MEMKLTVSESVGEKSIVLGCSRTKFHFAEDADR